MTTAEAAAEYRSNLDQDFTMDDALDADYLADDGEPEEERAILSGSTTAGLERVGAFVI